MSEDRRKKSPFVTFSLEDSVCNVKQTALMQACLYGHWESVQNLVLYRANIHRKDYLNGGTALHFAALNGHTRCIRILLADYVPSMAEFWNVMKKLSGGGRLSFKSETSSLTGLLNKPADGGITALHMAALNGHVETVQLLLDLGASLSRVTVDDGTTIDLIDGLPPSCIFFHSIGVGLLVLYHKVVYMEAVQEVLEAHPFTMLRAVEICSVASSTSSPPGSISCPLCRHGIVSFVKLPGTSTIKEMAQVSLPLPSSRACPHEGPVAASEATPLCRTELGCTQISPLVSASLRTLSLHRLPSLKFNSNLCVRASGSSPSLTSQEGSSRISNSVSSSCSRSSFRRSVSHNERTSCFSFSQYVATSSG
ncbi:hypothetical protein ACLOJK_002749 [Asimina triloba]